MILNMARYILFRSKSIILKGIIGGRDWQKEYEKGYCKIWGEIICDRWKIKDTKWIEIAGKGVWPGSWM